MVRFWWVVVFTIFCGAIYFQAIKRRESTLLELSFRLQEKEKEKLIALQEKDDLMLRLQSQNDPAWIEMILMKELGVAPEGWIKVHFSR